MQQTKSTLIQQSVKLFRAFHELTAADVPLADLGVSFFRKPAIVDNGGPAVFELYHLSSQERLAIVTRNDLPNMPDFLDCLREALLKLKVGEIAVDRAVVGRGGIAFA